MHAYACGEGSGPASGSLGSAVSSCSEAGHMGEGWAHGGGLGMPLLARGTWPGRVNI